MRNYIFLFCFLLYNCSSDSSDEQALSQSIDIESPSLAAPKNNEACLDGLIVNETQSKIFFSWTPSINAVSYNLNIKNLNDQQTQQFNVSSSFKEVTLDSSTPYSWYVTAVGENPTSKSDSDTWKFYLVGEPLINYSPFPPELLSPRSASTVTAIDGEIILKWDCSDIDEDLNSYEIYLDTRDASTPVKKIDHVSTTSETNVTVKNNTIYFWKVIAEDKNGNKSDSGVYTFITS